MSFWKRRTEDEPSGAETRPAREPAAVPAGSPAAAAAGSAASEGAGGAESVAPPVEPTTAEGAPPGRGAADDLGPRIVEVLKSIYDPEIPVNIYDMGLVYGVDVDEGRVTIRMTLTSPACPVAQSLPNEVEMKVAAIEGVRSARVEIVWDPPWTPDKMSEDAKLELGWY